VAALFGSILGPALQSKAQVTGTRPLPATPSTESLASNTNRVLVNAFQFQGNTVFSAKELSTVLTNFVGRPITSSDLEKARQLLSYYYIDRSYFNSGALLPDQKITNGIITVQIVEKALWPK
jgi:hemolysin activation/secretion protein